MATEAQLERLREFIAPPRIAMVATIGKDGMPQLTPNWYAYMGEEIIVSITKQRVKYRNVMRDPRAAVSICSEPLAEEYVTVRGPARIIDGDEIWGPTREIIERYTEPEKADEFLSELRKQDRVLLAVKPERVFFRYG